MKKVSIIALLCLSAFLAAAERDHALLVASAADRGHDVAVVDASIDDCRSLLAALPPDMDVISVRGDQDGLDAIADGLAGHHGVRALHIISHGAPGRIRLGRGWIDASTLAARTTDLSAIRAALRQDGDILIYGCDVAEGASGSDFLRTWADATVANVAASLTPTGAAGKGGDWILERQVGVISAMPLACPSFSGLLAETTLTFSTDEVANWSDGIAVDGDGGSTDIPGITIQAANVSDTSGSVITTQLTVGTATNVDAYDDGFDALTSYDLGSGCKGMKIWSATHFQMNGFEYWNWGLDTAHDPPITITVDGYSGGSKVATTSFVANDVNNLYYYKLVSLDSTFDYVDTVILYSSSDSYHGINRIKIDTAVPPTVAPSLTATGANPAFTEDGSAVDLYGTVTAATNDVGQTFSGMTVTVTNVTNSSGDQLSIGGTTIQLFNSNGGTLAGSIGSFAVGVSGGTATVTLSGMSRSDAQMGTLIDGMTFSNTSQDPGSSSRVVTITSITDNGSSNNSATPNIASTVSMTPVNDPPTLNATGGTPTYTENGAAVDLFSGVSVSTIESGQTITQLVVTVANVSDGANEILRIDATDVALTNGNSATTSTNSMSVSVSVVAGTATVTVSKIAGISGSAMATLVDALSYKDTSEDPSTSGNRVVTLTSIKDNGGTANSGVDTTTLSTAATVTVAATNDQPTITAPGSITVTEDVATALTGISFADVDAEGASETATLSVGSGTLAGTSGGGVTVSGSGTTSLTLSGTLANINTFISGSNVTFTTASNATSNVTLTVGVNDGGNTGSGGAQTNSTTVTLSVTAVNDAPTITAPGSITVTEDVATALTGISFADVDAGSASVTATLSVGSGTLAGTSGGGVTASGSGTASMTLSGSIANINTFISGSNVTFTTASNATSNVTLTVGINDGGNTGAGGAQTASTTVTLSVTAVNDAPTITAPGSITVTEDVATALTGISFADVDGGSASETVTLSAGSGTLAGTSGGGVTVSGSGTTSLTLSGSIANINTFISGSNVTFTTASNATSNVTLTVGINDGGNTGAGGAQTNSTTVTLSVTAVNDPPVITVPGAQHASENGALVFASANSNPISIADVDAGGNPIQLSLTATHGVLSLNSGAIGALSFSVGAGTGNATMTFTGTVANINSALAGMTYVPTARYYGAASVQIDADDQGFTGAGGAKTDSKTIGITVDPVSPQVISVSSITADGTYGPGATVTVTVRFSDAIAVDVTGGTPTLTLETGATDEQAIYTSVVDDTMSFEYTVQSGDQTADLDYTGTSALVLNGATVRSPASLDADLTLPTVGGAGSLGGQKAIAIDGVAPAVASVAVPSSGAYRAGQNLSFTVTFDEAVTVDTTGGTPRLALNIGGSTRYAAYASGTGTTQLVFSYTVQAGDTDSDGIALAGSLDANGGALRDGVGNDADATLNSVGSTASVLVDTTAPTATSLTRASGSPTTSASVGYSLVFGEAVSGVDASDFTLAATGSASGTISSVTPVDASHYTVVVNTITGDGTLRLDLKSSGTGIVDVAGNALSGGATGEVYAIDRVAPTVSSVAVPADGTYAAGQNLDVTVNFSEAVVVNTTGGTPSLALTIGSTVVQASYLSGSGTSALVFRYTLQSGDADADGIAMPGSISANGGTLQDGVGNNALLALNSIGSTAAVLVDGIAPTATALVRAGSSPANGASVSYTLTFSEDVTGVDAGDFTVATTGTVSGTVSGVTPVDGAHYTITVTAITGDGTLRLDLKGSGTGIADAPGNALSGGATGEVYAIDRVAPTVSSVTVPSSGSYRAGQNLDFTVAFSEAITVATGGGTPRLALTIGAATVHAAYLSGTGTSDLVFRYTVQAGDTDGDGIDLASSLDANGGTLRDAVGNDAALTLNAVGSTASVLVDTTAPTATALTRASASPTNGASVGYLLTFSEAVGGVDPSDFALVATGSASGAIGSVTPVDASHYTVMVTAVAGDGTLRVDLNASGTGIVDAAGNPLLGGMTGEVYTTDTTAPTVIGVAVPADGTYAAGQDLDFAVTFDEPVVVDATGGTPRLTLDVGGMTRYADYRSGSGTATLAFRATVLPGDRDDDGIALGGSIDAHGGTLRDAAGNDAALALVGAPSTAGILVHTPEDGRSWWSRHKGQNYDRHCGVGNGFASLASLLLFLGVRLRLRSRRRG
jgi:hypothetical protein